MFLCYIEIVILLSEYSVFCIVVCIFFNGQLPGQGQGIEVVREGCPVMNLNTLIQTLPAIDG